MSLARIKYKEKGFWIPEAFIEVLSKYICEVFEERVLSSFSENLQEIYNDCDSNREGSSGGMVTIMFDRYIKAENEKLILTDIFEQVKSLILSKGNELSIEVLDQFESEKTEDAYKSNWSFPIKTQSLVATLDIMEQLLRETWQSSNYSVYYTGFPNEGQHEEI